MSNVNNKVEDRRDKEMKEKSKSNKTNASSIRVLMPTRKLLSDIQKIIAEASLSSKVGVDDIIYEALELLKNSKDALSKLQLRKMSIEDEEQYTYQVYQKQNGEISWEEFRKKLRRGELVKLMKSIGLEV